MKDIFNAVFDEGVESTKRLLILGANPNQYEDEAKISLLHFAAISGNGEICQLLLAAGANPTAKTSDGLTPLDVSILHNNTMTTKVYSDVSTLFRTYF